MVTSLPNEDSWTLLLEALEEHLVKEGLLYALAKHRREGYLPPADRSWAAALVIVGFLVGRTASISWPVVFASTTIPLAIFLIARGLIKVIIALRLPIRWRTIGRIVLIATSLISGALAGRILGEVRWFVLYVLLTLPGYLILRAIFRHPQLLTLLSDAWHTLKHALWRTVRLAGLLLPLMVVFLLLSVFSSELWQSVGALALWQFGAALALILGVGALVGLSRTQSAVDSIPDPELQDPGEIIASALAQPLSTDSRLASMQSLLNQELSWRHVEKMHEQAIKTARQRLRWRIIGRLTTSAILLAMLMGGYLWLLFSLLFTHAVIDAFQAGLASTSTSPQITLVKVTLFLVAFIVTYFIIQALTEDRMQRELFQDLSSDIQNWVQTLVLYDVCQRPGYQLINSPIVHSSLDLAEIEVVVPVGTTDVQAKQICTHAVQLEVTAQLMPSVLVVTAYERRESIHYDWDIPGRQWQLVCSPYGGNFISRATQSENLRHQHSIGLESNRLGEPVSEEWFGHRAHDKVIARKLWEADRAQILYHPYSYSGPGTLWLFLRLRESLYDAAAYQALAEIALESIIKSELTDPFLICISLYIADSRQRLAYLLWRKHPEGQVFVQNDQSNSNAKRI